MCRMTDCCFYLPLREGCLLSSVFEFILVIVETIIYIFFNHKYHEDEKALWIAEICNLQMCSILLFLGSLKDERVCIILHCFFISIMLVAEASFQALAFKFAFFSRSPDWLIAYGVVYHCFLLYMIFVCYSYAVELRDNNFSDTGGAIMTNRHRPHRQMSSAMSSEIYGM